MKDMNLSNIQKESEKIRIKKSINESEDLKAQALLRLGIIAFDKIRKNEIEDNDFVSVCEEIKKLDIEIYTKYMQLKSFEKENIKNICECGYVAFKNEKFCPQCGRSLVKEEKTNIICSSCNQEIEQGSNFCACCGNKINKEETFENDFIYNEEIYCEEEFDYHKHEEEIPIVDMTEEDEVKNFLKENEKLVSEEVSQDKIGLDQEIIEDNSIEKEGRKILKVHENNTLE